MTTQHLLRFDSPIHNLQVFLRAISRRYPEIPDVLPDGVYGEATVNAVKAFQNKFLLSPTGTTDYSTWDHIVRVYKELEKENTARNLRIYPEGGLNFEDDSYMATIMIMQSMMLALSQRFSNIPPVTVNGVVDEETHRSIQAIQYASGLNPDGNITRTFWNYLSAIYEAYVSVDRVQNASSNKGDTATENPPGIVTMR